MAISGGICDIYYYFTIIILQVASQTSHTYYWNEDVNGSLVKSLVETSAWVSWPSLPLVPYYSFGVFFFF